MSRTSTQARHVPGREAPIAPAVSLPPQASAHVERGGAEERIRARAFEIYECRKRDGQEGSAELDWLRAEREVSGPRESGNRAAL